MLYLPPDPSLYLWDTWLFQQGETIHLFHLQRHRYERGCSSIGHAITQDWLHWETLPEVLSQGSGDDWDNGPLMTGMTLEHEGRFYLFYGAMVGRVQRIGVAVSDDLLHWEKYAGNPVLEAAGPWYETDPIQAINYETAWRDPYVFYHAPDRCFYAFICARVPGGNDVGGGCVAAARSETLLEWELLPPAYVSDALTCMEVPEVFSSEGRHYLTYTTSYHFGTPYQVQDAFQQTGTFYLESASLLTGYQMPAHPSALTASLPNSVANYVGRSVPWSGGRRLYYYHHVAPDTNGERSIGALAWPKFLEQTQAGQLVLRYAASLVEPQLEPVGGLATPLSPETALALADDSSGDGAFYADICQPYSGIAFRLAPAPDDVLNGYAVWLAPESQGSARWYVLLGGVHFAVGPAGQRPVLESPAALRVLNGEFHVPPRVGLKVICRGQFVDVYIDDVLYLSHTYDPAALSPGSKSGVFYAGHPKPSPVTSFSAYRFKR